MNTRTVLTPVDVSLNSSLLLRFGGVVVLAAAAYWLAGQAGMAFMFERANVSLLWPAAGVALALACRLGPAAAIGAGLGAFVTHFGMNHGAAVSTSVGIGTAVAAWFGAYLLARVGVRLALDRPVDVLRFLLIGAVPASVVSSLVGSGVLWLAGIARWSGFGSLWWVCWVADLMGILLLAPAILVALPRYLTRIQMGETVALLLTVAASSVVIYGDLLPPDAMLARPLSYAIFPLIIWAAMRTGPSLTAWVLVGHAALAVALTAGGHGPFAIGDLRHGMLSLHAHLAMVSLTGLLLAAAIAGRRAVEDEARLYLHELSHAGRLSAMGEMAAGLAHELNQPLCAIATYAQAARRMVSEDSEPALSRALTRLDDSAQRAGAIIRQMRGFLRRGSPETEPVDVNELVRDSLELTAPTLRHGEVTVQTRLAADLPTVPAAPVQIHQVLVNLVRNAVEALQERPSTQRFIEIATARDGDEYVAVSVADSGPGVPDGLNESLFEPFVSARDEGLGLGLSISRSIIEHHGGTLSVTPRAGGGAIFRFVLPVNTPREHHGT